MALHSETRAEFYLADLGILANGSIAAALYTTYPLPDQVKNVRASHAKAVFIEDPKSMQALLADGGEALAGLHWILLTGESEGALTLEQLRAKGRAALEEDPHAFEKIRAEVRTEDPAILYLTSGATGEPKMGLVRHAALTSNIDMGPQVLPLTPADCTIAFLPSAHIAQRVVIEFLPIRMGIPVWFSESLAKLPHEMKSIRPTFLLAPPRVWERVFASINAEIKKKSAAVKKNVSRRRRIGRRSEPAARGGQAGSENDASVAEDRRPPGVLEDPRASRRPYSNRRLGRGAARQGLGAILRGHRHAAHRRLRAHRRRRGLFESARSSEVRKHRREAARRGAAFGRGRRTAGQESGSVLRLLQRSRGNRMRCCAMAGCYTGDIAEIDSDGYVYITGRKKELIVSSNGKKIYPARIEMLFKSEPVINQVVLIGDRLPYVTALVTVNAAEVATVRGG